MSGEKLQLSVQELKLYDSSLKSKCFVVNDSSDKIIDGFPSNANDFLLSVRREAEKIPDIVRKNPPVEKISLSKNHEDLFKMTRLAYPEHAPKKQWSEYMCTRFEKCRDLYVQHEMKLKTIKKTSELRPKLPLAPLPVWKDKDSWRLYTLGTDIAKNKDKDTIVPGVAELRERNMEGDPRDVCKGVQEELQELGETQIHLDQLKRGLPPLMRIILKFDVKIVEALLKYHKEWIDEFGFSHNQGSWIYGLLCMLKNPMNENVISCIRDLSRRCAEERDVVVKKDKTGALLNALNMIIVIIGKYYKQSDLLD